MAGKNSEKARDFLQIRAIFAQKNGYFHPLQPRGCARTSRRQRIFAPGEAARARRFSLRAQRRIWRQNNILFE
ncbi:hypothetical protein K9U39_13940 [Rhodoblastus acidophilus]|nr:hypothetical protein [Rhodoblastus acidophilus]